MQPEQAKLFWHGYKYFPYEKELALREVQKVLAPEEIVVKSRHVEVSGCFSETDLKKLVYFSYYLESGTNNYRSTLQYELEHTANNLKRQSTRYSVHGLHEYKGKFNPQVVRSILNILGVRGHDTIFDPFCGSGTSLVECAHVGLAAVGCDINPLAIYLSNAKLQALTTPAETIKKVGENIFEKVLTQRNTFKDDNNLRERERYLMNWFPAETFKDIELFRSVTLAQAELLSPIYLTLASNLLRDYSLQEPADLRIRRRKGPLPERSFFEALKISFDSLIERVQSIQEIIGLNPQNNYAYLSDSRLIDSSSCAGWGHKPPYQAAITSPPYATALPYIDTQRLSLVWLDLCQPAQILNYESILIGSREFRTDSQKLWVAKMWHNTEMLPKLLLDYCLKLQRALSASDGFRRNAVPALLYRYFADMQKMFQSVLVLLASNAPFALIVGHNHTILGGVRYDIDTPNFLVMLAQSCGWVHEVSLPLQTYQRYGPHQNNAVTAETLIILRKP
jgi:site-specific DNA-methyltransferase (cytosine-N4-specific)